MTAERDDEGVSGLPSFRAYLRVMRHRPGFWLAVAAAVSAFAGVWRDSGLVGVVLSLSATLVFIVLFFPWWRRLARRNPDSWSWYQPELLAEEEELHPDEPGSNVRRVDK